jgi:hypothetical protein
MPALDMAKLMCDNALHLIGGGGGVDQAGVKIHRLPARDKGVDRLIIDQDDFDIGRIKLCRTDQRFRDFPEESLCFRVAQD